ncbi:MAG: hypothetical protein PVF91_10180 [Chromatiales bacterium]|jgi:hypothetical protein
MRRLHRRAPAPPPPGVLRLLVLTLAAALLAGCANISPRPAPLSLADLPGDGEPAWQRVRFRIHWPEGEDPAWHLDALLADRVIGPVLQRNHGTLSLWRFHRRAARDAAGHSLSFLVFASRARGEALCDSLSGDPQVAALMRAGFLDSVECSRPPGQRAGRIGGTSDPEWPPEIQRTWPFYIMGVSEMWLRLIDELAREPEGSEARSLDELVEHYRQVHDDLSALWASEGEHAFLHHLNALFAYEPIYLIERRAYRF